MGDEGDGPRGAAGWEAQRAAIAKRNGEARKRGQAERRSAERAVAVRQHDQVVREAKELDELNAQIAKGRIGA